MSILRRTVAAFLVVAWLPAVNVCALADAFQPAEADPCCEMDSSAPEPTDTCGDCSTLENGLPLSALSPLVAPTPDFRANVWLTDLLATLAVAAANKSLVFEHSGIPPDPPLWHFVARVAVPVRGPSFA